MIDAMTLGESVAEERETSHSASSPEAVMRTGGRVQEPGYIIAPSLSSVNRMGWDGEGRGYVTAYLWQSEEGSREQINLV